MDGSRRGKAAAERLFGGDLPASAATGRRAATPGHHGHRARLRRSPADGGPNAIAAPAGGLEAAPVIGDAGVTALKAVEAAAAAVFGTVVHELLVVGRGRHASIRREGLL